MENVYEYKFAIEAFTPNTIPMARLAKYMGDLAAFLGEEKSVHFLRVDTGSTVLVQRIEQAAIAKVKKRIQAFEENDGPEDVNKAFREIDRRLAEDNATGCLYAETGAAIIRFPGCERQQPLTFGHFSQYGSLDGELIRIGGRDKTVPVHLKDGDSIHKCLAKREIARKLSHHLFGNSIRVHGDGRWHRDAEKVWVLDRFVITDFETLDDAPLSDVVDRLRGVSESGWRGVADPIATLNKLRQGQNEIH